MTSLAELEHRYRHDRDKADKAPRSAMYFDIGFMISMIRNLQDQLEVMTRRCQQLEFERSSRS